MALSIDGLEVMKADDVKSDYLRALIHGRQGAGKTTFASTIAGAGKTLFVDFVGEKGIRSFQNAPYAKNIDVVRPTSITMLDDLFWELDGGNHDYNAVVLDSLTAIQKMTMRYLLKHDETAVREIKQGTAPADIRTWGQALEIMQDTATFWFGLADGDREKPMHVIMTAQTKITEDETTGATTHTPDVQKGALSITLAAPDYVMFADVEDNPDAIVDDEDVEAVKHIVRFGAHPEYRTKARLPQNLRGRIPSVLGRKTSPDLVALARTLGVGGVPKAASKKKAPAQTAAASTASN